MSAVAVWLLVVGFCDLLRAARDVTSLRRRLVLAELAVTLFVGASVAMNLSAAQVLGLGGAWVVGGLLWVFGSAAALTGGGTPARVVAFAGLGGGFLVTLLGGGVVEPIGPAPGWLDGSLLESSSVDWLLLVLGVALVQLSTANIAVRLVLDAVGVPAGDNEKRLKGGRMLGPMERLFILGLGLAGDVTAAAVVVAAKGLLRFPALQRGTQAAGPTDVTEYFLIGSFASWLVANGGLALVVLAR